MASILPTNHAVSGDGEARLRLFLEYLENYAVNNNTTFPDFAIKNIKFIEV
jgi:hypothetical protein